MSNAKRRTGNFAEIIFSTRRLPVFLHFYGVENREHVGRVALVTGASRGIGKAIALKLGSAGATVLCVSRSLESSLETMSELKNCNVCARAYAVDVGQMSAVKVVCEDILREWNRDDILVNCAGITRDNLLLRMGDEEWNDVLRTDLDSCFAWTKHLCRPMMQNRWGRIINVSSVVGLTGNAGQSNYAAAKAAVIGFTKAIARELATRAITANAIAPGFIGTDMTATLSEKIKDKILEQIPVHAFGTAEDVAHGAAFLASDAARYITGHTLTIDGGMTMQ
ncbi:MAG: 3-oxoacyl-[acyl-carrier-protein] reductase [Puniceicoccales bacterium]|jgi:3-oxoacyl-[acyl-carrier protein] reductase|nr:3-oxoacyl-[acyl-carrier-protein] reductase [Puniceicoccales bacterium]